MLTFDEKNFEHFFEKFRKKISKNFQILFFSETHFEQENFFFIFRPNVPKNLLKFWQNPKIFFCWKLFWAWKKHYLTLFCWPLTKFDKKHFNMAQTWSQTAILRWSLWRCCFFQLFVFHFQYFVENYMFQMALFDQGWTDWLLFWTHLNSFWQAETAFEPKSHWTVVEHGNSLWPTWNKFKQLFGFWEHSIWELSWNLANIEDDFRTSDPSGSLLPSQFNDNIIQRDTCAQSGSLVTWKMDWGWPSGCNLGTWITFHFRSGFKVQQLNNFTKKGWQKVTCDTCIHAQTNVLFNFL